MVDNDTTQSAQGSDGGEPNITEDSPEILSRDVCLSYYKSLTQGTTDQFLMCLFIQ